MWRNIFAEGLVEDVSGLCRGALATHMGQQVELFHFLIFSGFD